MAEILNQQVSEALKAIARNEDVKKYLLSEPKLYETVLKSAERFIAGESLGDCVKGSKLYNSTGHSVTIDFMGESARGIEIVNDATKEFLNIINEINNNKLDSSISLDLSHIGLALDKNLANENAEFLAEKSSKSGIEMMISMEGSERTDEVLEIYFCLSKKYSNVGITIQANLFRTDNDLKNVISNPGKIRLVKGAFQETDKIARKKGLEVDNAYKIYLKTILENNRKCSIATHDSTILNFATELIVKEQIDKNIFEFEMLKGVTFDKLGYLKNQGYKTRIYLPYGKEWYLYLCHRLAENPLNIYQAIVDVIELKKELVSIS